VVGLSVALVRLIAGLRVASVVGLNVVLPTVELIEGPTVALVRASDGEVLGDILGRIDDNSVGDLIVGLDDALGL